MVEDVKKNKEEDECKKRGWQRATAASAYYKAEKDEEGYLVWKA